MNSRFSWVSTEYIKMYWQKVDEQQQLGIGEEATVRNATESRRLLLDLLFFFLLAVWYWKLDLIEFI